MNKPRIYADERGSARDQDSLEELEPWIARIKQIAAKTKESYVIKNNHFRGQVVVNALEIKATLTEASFGCLAAFFKSTRRC